MQKMNQSNQNKRNAVIGISAAFVLLFVLIRLAPVEPCEVLHYGDYMNEEGESSIAAKKKPPSSI